MTIKTFLTATLLVLTPMVASAQCNWYSGTQEAAISCADGMTWDADAMSCVEIVSS